LIRSLNRSLDAPALRISWGLLRIPALLAVVYLYRGPILNAVEARFDIAWITVFVIGLASTPVARVLFVLSMFLLLLLALGISRRRLSDLQCSLFCVAITFAGLALVMRWTGVGMSRALPAVLVLATNWICLAAPAFLRFRRAWGIFMWLGVGLAEILCTNQFIRWLRRGTVEPVVGRRVSNQYLCSAMPGAALASGVAACLLGADGLISIERAVRMPEAARIVARGDFNEIQLNPDHTMLLATGHGIAQFRKYPLRPWSGKYSQSIESTGGAQGFAYDPGRNEIYLYNTENKELMYLDADTLVVRRRLPIVDLSPGDPWIAVDAATNRITIASEADLQIGQPIAVFDRDSGALLHQRKEEVGNLFPHPSRSILYMAYFRRSKGVFAYDIKANQIAATVDTPTRIDRMAYVAATNELLVASPIESSILRFDADTLEPKGGYAANFGVRVLALDVARSLIFAGSLSNGTVAVIDLNTGRRRATFYLGPWLRSIAIDETGGVAYVSSNGALYELAYGATISKTDRAQ
jgi:hypothetical protein